MATKMIADWSAGLDRVVRENNEQDLMLSHHVRVTDKSCKIKESEDAEPSVTQCSYLDNLTVILENNLQVLYQLRKKANTAYLKDVLTTGL